MITRSRVEAWLSSARSPATHRREREREREPSSVLSSPLLSTPLRSFTNHRSIASDSPSLSPFPLHSSIFIRFLNIPYYDPFATVCPINEAANETRIFRRRGEERRMNESCVQILSLTQFATLFLPSRIDEIHRTVEKGTHLERREKKLITIYVYVYTF